MINKLNQESRRAYNEKIKQVFGGDVAEGWQRSKAVWVQCCRRICPDCCLYFQCGFDPD